MDSRYAITQCALSKAVFGYFLGNGYNNNGITMMRIWIFNWCAVNLAIGFIEIPEITESKKWQPLYRELSL